MITPNERLPKTIKQYLQIGRFQIFIVLLLFGCSLYFNWSESDKINSIFSYTNIVIIAIISTVFGIGQLLLLKYLIPEFIRFFYAQKAILNQNNILNPEINTPPLEKIQNNLKVSLIFWVLACLPGPNFFAALFLLYLLIYQKYQSDTKILITERRGFKLLIILASFALIPIIGTIFSIVGFIKSLLLINRYKAE